MTTRSGISLAIAITTVGCTIDADTATSTTSQEVDVLPPQPDKLELWLDGERGVGLSSTGQVIWWEDQSGHGRIMARGNPTYDNVQLAKFPHSDRHGIQFTPADLNAGYLVNGDVVLKQPFTVAMMIYPTEMPPPFHHDWYVPFTGITAPTVTITQRVETNFQPGNTGEDNMFAATGGSGPTFSYVPVPHSWTSGAHVVIAVFNGPYSQLRVDDVVRRGALTTSMLTGVVLSNAGRPFSGYIGEVLIYKGAFDRWFAEPELAGWLHDRFLGAQ